MGLQWFEPAVRVFRRGVPAVLVLAVLMGAAMTASGANLDDDMAGFRKDLLDINKRLLLMEEELLFPADTQVTVFVSLDVGKFFSPDAITLKLDGKTIESYLYTEKEVRALRNGAIQKLATANVRDGVHELTAFVAGMGPNGREFRRAASLNFRKGSGRHYIQLKLEDDVAAQQTELRFREWQ